MKKREFVDQVVYLSRTKGLKIETNRNDQRQIDFGNKKLHEGHLARIYPNALDQTANIPKLIEQVAPGRPCTHKPMKEIIDEILRQQ